MWLLYSGASGVCVYFVCVYMVLCFVALFCVPLNLFFSLGSDFGVFVWPFGESLDHFGAPPVAMEVALVCLGVYIRSLTK